MPQETKLDVVLNCPVPIAARESILLGHGSGGRMSGDLLRDILFRPFKIPCSNGWMIKPSWMSADPESRLRQTLSS